MNRSLLCLALCLFSSFAWAAEDDLAPAAETELDPAVDEGLATLRGGLLESFNKGDIDGLLKLVTPDVVVTWQNAEVCRGPEGVREYYERIVTGPHKVVSAATANPEISGRHMHGDWGLSWGLMNDRFTLTDGTELDMHSHFTAVVRREDGEWRIAAFHVSVNAFDNSILKMAVQKTMIWGAGLGGAVALIVGLFIGRKTKRAAASELRS
jgi:ketosteroid isomerase-like protein